MKEKKKYDSNSIVDTSTTKKEENKKEYFIPRRIDAYHIEKIFVNEEEYKEITRFNDCTRKQMQRSGECVCPKAEIWKCDCNCEKFCPYFRRINEISLDDVIYENSNDGSQVTYGDIISDSSIIEVKILKIALRNLADELLEKDRDLGIILKAFYELYVSGKIPTISNIEKMVHFKHSTFCDKVKKLSQIPQMKEINELLVKVNKIKQSQNSFKF